jgi:hypothetical protein
MKTISNTATHTRFDGPQGFSPLLRTLTLGVEE